MSGAVTPATRLLAMLADEPSLETRAPDEVRADLAALGVDPTRATALARRLAGSAGTPAARLLEVIAAAEASDDEVRRLEAADIDDVRRQVPVGHAASIAADARRKAGLRHNVVGLRVARRGAIRRWGGPLAGIAASLLVAFVLGREYLISHRFELQQAAQSEQQRAPVGALDAPARKQSFAEAERRSRVLDDPAREALSPQSTTEPDVDAFAKSQESRADAPMAVVPETPPQGAGETATEGAANVGDRAVAGNRPAPGLMARDEIAPSRPAESAAPAAPMVATMLIVDPQLAPPAQQYRALPPGDLGGRLDEARQVAGGRPVVALFTILTGTAKQDFVQVALPPRMTQQRAAPSPLADMLGADAARFDFLPLPDR